MESGIQLADYYLQEALRLVCLSSVEAQLTLAATLLEWIREQGMQQLHLAEVYQRGPKPFRTAKRALKAITVLEDHGHVFRLEAGTVVDGKPRQYAWEIVL